MLSSHSQILILTEKFACKKVNLRPIPGRKNVRIFLTMMISFLFLSLASGELAYAQRGPQRPGPGPRPGDYRPQQPVPRPTPGYPSQGPVSCRSYSTKLFGGKLFGYGSCQSCLAKNSKCNEICSEQVNVCTVQGVDYEGFTRDFIGSGGNRFDAEREARRMCDYNRNMRQCVTTGCSINTREISRVRCQ